MNDNMIMERGIEEGKAAAMKGTATKGKDKARNKIQIFKKLATQRPSPVERRWVVTKIFL